MRKLQPLGISLMIFLCTFLSITVTNAQQYDLSIVKSTITPGFIKYGVAVPFNFNVTNNSTESVYDVVIRDVIPAGFQLDAGGSPGWVTDPGNPDAVLYTISGELMAAEMVTVSIDLNILPTTDNADWINLAQIVDYFDSGSNSVVNQDTNPADNMETEEVPMVDLALRKDLVTVAPFNYGDPMTFEITVYNQANTDVTDIQIIDYIPEGYSFVPANNIAYGWTGVGPTPTNTIASLASRADTTITIELMLEMNSANIDGNAWDNYAAINSFVDESLIPSLDNDADSEAGTNSIAENSVMPGDPDDGNILGGGPLANPPEDEDDHDPAAPVVMDLALIKERITAVSSFSYEQEVTYGITIFNQGNVGAQQIEIVDYLACGIEFLPLKNPMWTYDNVTRKARRTITGPIDPAMSDTIQLRCKVMPCYNDPATAWTNYAEIASAMTTSVPSVPFVDIDSDLDDTNSDPGGIPVSASDNSINGNGKLGGDEDDHDPELLEVVDFALKKRVQTPGPYIFGQNVTFMITLFNQGNIISSEIQTIDYVRPGFNFNLADNAANGWSINGASEVIHTLSTPLMPGDSIDIFIDLEFTTNGSNPEDYYNYAHIYNVKDTTSINNNRFDDADSFVRFENAGEQSTIPGDDNDDEIFENGFLGEDEDDHDPAGISPEDLSLEKTIPNPQASYQYGDPINFEISVTNEGVLTATNVQVVDYVSCGYSFSTNNNTGWNEDPITGYVYYDVTNPIAPGQTVVIPLVLTLEACNDPSFPAWKNRAEISMDGDTDDGDSVPDDNPDNDGNGDCGDCQQTVTVPLAAAVPTMVNEIFVDGALLALGYPYDLSNPVDQQRLLTDCAAFGYVVTAALVNNGTAVAFTVSYPNENFESVSLGTGEVYFFECHDCNSGGPFEDDYDCYALDVFDLKLDKLIGGGGMTFSVGDPITFQMSVTNEGNVAATNFVVTDYLPCGYTFSTVNNTGWVLNGVTGYLDFMYIGNLLPGQSMVITLNLTVASCPQGTTPDYDNVAEISDDGDETDSDSTPDDIPDNDPPGEDDIDDISIMVPGSLGGDVWKDLNNDGLQDSNEPPVSGVTVNLFTCGGTFVGSTTSGVDGSYYFMNITAGSYYVVFDITSEPDCIFTLPNVGMDDTIDSDAEGGGQTACVNVMPGEMNDDLDAGLVFARVTIGDFVFEDIDGDGVQDFGEPGIPNVLVKLFDVNSVLVNQTATNASGYYSFDVLSSNYYLQFCVSEEYEPTISDIGAEDSDSDVTDAEGPNTTDIFFVPPAIDNYDLDGGFYKCVTICGFTWYDINQNNIRDAVENGINGLEVNVYVWADGQYILEDSDYSAMDPSTPSGDGYFEFCVRPGRIYVEVVMPPLGLVLAQPFVGNPNFDSDINGANGPGTTPSYVLNSGQGKCDIGAGYYPMATAGRSVWMDENINGLQEANEPRMEGILVEAFTLSNEKVAETWTDENGEYMIDYLTAQEHYFRFTPPIGYNFTFSNQSEEYEEMNSDVDHSHGLNTTKSFMMVSGEHRGHIDAGLAFGALPVTWLDIKVEDLGSYHKLSWATASEANSERFVIERRLSTETDFKAIGQVIAAGQSTIKSDYAFRDTDIGKGGTYYYRLRQFDFDGRNTLSKIVSLSKFDETGFAFYPNPSSGFINFEWPQEDYSKLKMEIFDDSGRLVAEETLLSNTKTSIDISRLKSGVYSAIVKDDYGVFMKEIRFIRI